MTPEEMIQRYRAGQSAVRIANEAGRSVWLVLNRLRARGEKIRTNQNERLLGRTSERLWELVDGLLLGDASFDRKGALRLQQAPVRAGWVQQVAEQFQAYGVSTRIVTRPPRSSTIEGRELRSQGSLLLYTPCYREFQEVRRRWYPAGVKQVPADLRITPYSIAHWFAGDGSGSPDGALIFYTNGFRKAEVQRLAAQIRKELLVEARACPRKPRRDWIIRITKRNEAVWLAALIEDELAACCHYKLRYVRATKRF